MSRALTKRNADVARGVRRWYRQAAPEAILQQTTIGAAARDVSVVALAHIMRRLQNKKTPVETKDALALAMAMKPPRVTVHETPNMPPPRGDGSEQALMAAYQVQVEPPPKPEPE